ncbi:5-methyltetrahydropteroyltriglutamate--homocysteine S-methyltransferase [Gracilibacillus halophilus YIM-C55.5]|uniref:5-methyltetrahydropteroyltriglutamate--homocysteine S-methyltransferase n=1 Tax=Gracilibacillus halophilus YIM-C55.5 TaxID=1308866 RepID=N4WTN0_9BACI|nr:5-methyltetrahydropteroyltriglutamate--homocysteine S-methyltransferase [Gracilibacillus halophilus YIM-C55.5]
MYIMTTFISSNIGYPRIGKDREWKHALESYWRGDQTEEGLRKELQTIRLNHLQKQKELGIEHIPVGDFSFYDHMLDTAFMFNVIPKRFQSQSRSTLDTYFAMARGTEDAVAAEMTKWFNTNYHYIVPELDDIEPSLRANTPLNDYQEAKRECGIDGKPVIVGPITFLKLSKGKHADLLQEWLSTFIPLYQQVFSELAEAGARWIQVDEPILATNLSTAEWELIEACYTKLTEAVPEANLLLQTYFSDIPDYQRLIQLPVTGIGLDFVYGDNLSSIKKYGFPKDKTLAAGIINGRNVWQADLESKLAIIDELSSEIPEGNIWMQPSCSLLHVPVTKTSESKLDQTIYEALCFADEKLSEITTLVQASNHGKESVEDTIHDHKQALQNFLATQQFDEHTSVTASMPTRNLPFTQRRQEQETHLSLPILPTTTIGSLPQTDEVRSTRRKWRRKEITDSEYQSFIRDEIAKWINIQEELELDVLVHGEFERTDMVEYFGEKLNGFTVSEYGWVQSYGSRCVKPPLIVGNVEWTKEMTVREVVYAQSLTEKPVKGMLTGPVTIYNWSFAHEALSRDSVQNQIALALEKEVLTLEEAGISIIQVDEPALREGLPLDRNRWNAYFDAAVRAFRYATSSVQPGTQIHTHMCYSEFSDIYETIDALDADVISIETSRSHGELIQTFEENDYQKEIGLGVYDIHSHVYQVWKKLEQILNVRLIRLM